MIKELIGMLATAATLGGCASVPLHQEFLTCGDYKGIRKGMDLADLVERVGLKRAELRIDEDEATITWRDGDRHMTVILQMQRIGGGEEGRVERKRQHRMCSDETDTR